MIVTARYGHHAPTGVKDTILYYPSITRDTMDYQCEITWDENYGAGLGRHPTENYGAGLDNPENQAAISKQCLRYKIPGLWVKNSLTTYTNRKLRDFRSEYTLNTQYDGAVMLFVIVKMVQPDTCTGCSDINTNLENMKMSQFKYDIPKTNLHILEWMNEIYIDGKNYSETVRQEFNLYYTS